MKKLLFSSICALAAVFILSFVVNYAFYLLTSDVFGVLMAAYVSYITTLVAGVALVIYGYPVHYFLNKYNISSYKYYLLSGALPCIAIVFIFKPLGNDSIIHLIQQSILFAIIGLVVSGVFWFVQIKRKT